MIGVSDVCRELGAGPDEVKMWARRFKEHLSEHANPEKGKPRQFTKDDLLILAYVCWYWDDNPDIEDIEAGLNCGEHYNMDYDVLTFGIPLFQDPPDELDETWRSGCLVGGIIEDPDIFTLAESFKLAGDTLVDAALKMDEQEDLLYPALFSYRHAVELYLKAMVPSEPKHGIGTLVVKLCKHLKDEFNTEVPARFKEALLTFDEFDEHSTTFRYGMPIESHRTGDTGEFWLDLNHLRNRMEYIAKEFRSLHQRLNRKKDNKAKET